MSRTHLYAGGRSAACGRALRVDGGWLIGVTNDVVWVDCKSCRETRAFKDGDALRKREPVWRPKLQEGTCQWLAYRADLRVDRLDGVASTHWMNPACNGVLSGECYCMREEGPQAYHDMMSALHDDPNMSDEPLGERDDGTIESRNWAQVCVDRYTAILDAEDTAHAQREWREMAASGSKRERRRRIVA